MSYFVRRGRSAFTRYSRHRDRMSCTNVRYVSINSPLVGYCSEHAQHSSGNYQNSERESQNEYYSFIILQRFSDGCMGHLKRDMEKRRFMSGINEQRRSYTPCPTNKLTKQASGNTLHNRSFNTTKTKSILYQSSFLFTAKWKFVLQQLKSFISHEATSFVTTKY
jgi:hypothetical protein